jgi:hypothetical protein
MSEEPDAKLSVAERKDTAEFGRIWRESAKKRPVWAKDHDAKPIEKKIKKIKNGPRTGLTSLKTQLSNAKGSLPIRAQSEIHLGAIARLLPSAEPYPVSNRCTSLFALRLETRTYSYKDRGKESMSIKKSLHTL